MRKLLVVVMCIFFMPGMLPEAHGAEDSFSFTWGFFLKDSGGSIRSLSFEGQELVANGDLLRIYLELRDRSYVYLYLFDSVEDLYMVFPPGPGFYSGGFPAWHKTYIPSGRNWFTLDDIKGTEKFFLLASPTRLTDLEELTGRFMADRDDSDLQDFMLKFLQEKIGMFSVGSSFDSVPAKVPHGKLMGISNPVPLMDARTITTNGNYGVVLDLVNK